jgi:hypothetical protein
LKREEQELVKRETKIKEKELDIEKQLKEIREKEA